ncbi:MAG: tagaturonate reductase [Rhodothermaceae bacterium]|nr:tagaturonate reductase [Rhodothermaceae bacterium]MYC03224.1 tagaturonate reductase [Rhodothermaceae bacterium]MYI17104.1 tagaturonate reductase [Rhodothermaceae bacterium]
MFSSNNQEERNVAEKILQFGTGRFLRAFADCLIDEARKSRTYDGRIVMVASTPSGRAELLNDQKGRYTLWTRGHWQGELIDEFHSVTSVSRALSASHHWDEVLAVAKSPHLETILSNTTEIGLSLQDNDPQSSPQSFPGRLCALLYTRADFFDYADSSRVTVLPCELIDNNGDLLRDLIIEQAQRWSLEARFTDWVQHSILFCNTLVDRIVPGLPGKTELEVVYSRLGYTDELLTVCEPYRLWAIQGDETLHDKLGFSKGADGVVIAPDISPYRTRKIRLLNGGHTLSVPVGLLAGCETVLDSMTHPAVSKFIESLLRDEIGPVLPVDPATVAPYIDKVLQRWQNPYMHHRLIDITLQTTTKLRHRAVPTLVNYYEMYPAGPAPGHIALGFAAWLRFMRGFSESDGTIYSRFQDTLHPIHDDHAEQFRDWWPVEDRLIPGFVQEVLSDQSLWGISLNDLPRFTGAVQTSLQMILNHGIEAALSGTQRPQLR